jgi:hypothetical protein
MIMARSLLVVPAKVWVAGSAFQPAARLQPSASKVNGPIRSPVAARNGSAKRRKVEVVVRIAKDIAFDPLRFWRRVPRWRQGKLNHPGQAS